MRTEDVSERFRGLDAWPVEEIVAALAEGQLAAAAAVNARRAELAAAAAEAAVRLAQGRGRLVYAGAGASGRIAVQDGVELRPTYGWPDERLVYLMAGGQGALTRSVEGAEDDAEGAAAAARALNPGPGDVALCVAASGRTPWAVAVAQAMREAGALVIGLAGNAGTPLLEASDRPILLETGAEVVAGSTRMAAGTAQKAALNILSTAIMVRLGGTYDNLMARLASSNAKLDGRRLAILRAITGAGEAEARAALAASGARIEAAALTLRGLSLAEAEALAARAPSLRAAFAEIDGRR
ncbi:N-acetylmuramic acid 6-phosphate etherase [Rubrimonas cliftonensis]|uniref:N-acetylmuramic acid 6-phosphate etherase n=1 Tax=Rubrimonas cliftonensis TaxID=89524 RepID=A0A1H4B8T8_9RHOB|nr:N-acetylmuramic acid 6-phosphate etherase [Rubrimonas cliftonensis]SEA44561.1 N-acetylmuramic acid 6-phosphate etherase [Rubrimonas cliftonensis]